MTAQHRPDATDVLTTALRERVLVLDGAMGTMIQSYGLGEADFRGERFADHPSDLRGNNDLLVPHPARRRRGHPPRLPRGGRRPRRHQHLQRPAHLPRRLRDGRPRLRDERRGRGAGAGRGRRRRDARADRAGSSARSAPPTARRRSPPTSTTRGAQRHLRRARRGLPRAGPRPRRRRRRPPHGRDDLRHAQRQGGRLRPRDPLRGARPAVAGHALRAPSPTPRDARCPVRSPRPSGTRCATPARSPSG